VLRITGTNLSTDPNGQYRMQFAGVSVYGANGALIPRPFRFRARGNGGTDEFRCRRSRKSRAAKARPKKRIPPGSRP
jgi:hypothetical protein